MDFEHGIAAPVLRRLDWRYLIPTPPTFTFDRITLIGADDQLCHAVVAIGLAKEVSTTLGDHDADLVAVLSPARVVPGQIVNAVRPGGTIYIEVDRRQGGSRSVTPRRLAARLSTHGASITAQYVLRPRPDACEIFVPLDESGALRWFLSSVYVASTPTKLIGEIAIRTLLGSSARGIGRLVPFHATVATVPPASGTTLSSAILGAIGKLDTPPSMATITHGRNRLVQIAFPAQAHGVPQLVAKIPRQESSDRRTRHEHAMVSRIRQALGPPDGDSIPRSHEVLELASGGSVAVEDAQPGCSLARSCGRWGRSLRPKVDDLELATSWLIRLHRDHVIRHGCWDDERQTDAVDVPLSAFVSRFGVSSQEAELFDATRAAAKELSGAPLPFVWEHGDFTIWNIFRNGQRVHVLDWEYSRGGVPLADMIRLVTHWHEAVRGLTTAETRYQGFGHLFCGCDAEHAATTAARASVERYETALGLDARFRSIFLVTSRVELAVRRYEQLLGDGMLAEDVRAGNAALGYLSTLAGQRTTLFPTTQPPPQRAVDSKTFRDGSARAGLDVRAIDFERDPDPETSPADPGDLIAADAQIDQTR